MKPLAKTITHTLAAIGMAGAAISPALAGEVQTMTISVDTADLDLGTVKGQKTLDQRVEKAVRSVCRTTSAQTGSRVMSDEARTCLAKARADARQQVALLLSNERRGG
ncbi:UrcA family protein [Erythrobacter donghaensis]|uniref:UrcA family protein n=1 Tax=Erythrobacter donghaensis TaxID=267135 RepID=UPI000A3CB4B2|nr:UrcA family protein [Erythrobacter donghaensis]